MEAEPENVQEKAKAAQVEYAYEFPIEKGTLFVDFQAKVLDTVISTKVKEKDKAKKEYDEAVKKGKIAVMA